jgi:predicted acyltransferase
VTLHRGSPLHEQAINQEGEVPMTSYAPPTANTRLVSLDVMRGLTIAFMILVNNNGDGDRAFWALKHTQWNGFTPTDLVFPTFLFLMGVSVVFSTDSRLARGAKKLSLVTHALRRSIILFLLGLLVNGFPFFAPSTLRIYGVLPRIAICYLAGSMLYVVSRRVSDKVFLLAVSLIGYWILMRWVTVPGYGLPGRDIPLLDKDANLAAYLDRHIFPGRLYEGTRDPEGLLSTLPALGTTLAGMLAGLWLRSSRTLQTKAAGLAAAGLLGLASAGLWNFWFPINKKLWTSSYALYAAGWSLLILALCVWLVEIRQWKKGLSFWLAFGTNAISAYVFAELLQSTLSVIFVRGHVTVQKALYLAILHTVPSAPFASLLYSLGFVAVCWIPIFLLHRKHIWIKI